jgi:hypothetical protein
MSRWRKTPKGKSDQETAQKHWSRAFEFPSSEELSFTHGFLTREQIAEEL